MKNLIMISFSILVLGCSKVDFSALPAIDNTAASTKPLSFSIPYEKTVEEFKQDSFGANTVTVQFQVSDQNGNVPGLKPKDINLIENGKPVTNFTLESSVNSVGRNADIVFVIDDTQSMQPYIDQVKVKVAGFVQDLEKTNIKATLCLVTFGDYIHKPCNSFVEDIASTPQNENLQAFLNDLSQVYASGGGDMPENPLEALRLTALSAPWHSDAQRLALVITDSTFHYSPENIGDASNAPTYADTVDAISSSRMATFVVGPDRLGYNGNFQGKPGMPQATGGKWYNFDDILNGTNDLGDVSNVRTSMSSGSSTPGEVITEARLAGLDYLILTDTGKTDAPSYSGYRDGLLVMDEAEYSFLDARLIFLSLSHEEKSKDPSELSIYFTDLLSQKSNPGSEQLLIHAFPFNRGPTWTGPYPTGVDGIEILNSKSLSQRAWDKSKFSVIWSFVTYPFNPRLSFLRLFNEPVEEIALWDKLSASRPTWGFAGAEANAKAIPLANYLVKFPSYQMSLEVMSNHVLLSTELTGSYEKDREKLFNALKKGQFYASLDLLGDPKGFNAVVTDRDKTYMMGSRIKFSKNQKIIARLPIEPKDFYEIVLFKNGDREMISNSQELSYDVKSPGVYRVFVRVSPTLPLPDAKKWISWIYTNPFYIE